VYTRTEKKTFFLLVNIEVVLHVYDRKLSERRAKKENKMKATATPMNRPGWSVGL
jgi:hypothetical protein